MNCLDDEAVLGLVEGRLAAAALDAAEGHLDSCDRCRDVVAHLARVRSPSRILERGRQIGKYVVDDLLGTGAMGRVYSAWQPELDRRVAIKVLRDEVEGGRDRLIKEAQAMARLDHPNVVGVYEVGSLEDDAVYVVMDLVEGDTLRAWAEQPRPWREAVRVLIDVARGLAAVHTAGVIHRDVKPDNIVIGTDGRARLADFGLARGAGIKTRQGSRLADSVSFDDTMVATPSNAEPRATAIGDSPHTAGTSIAGTPVYMAPEVLRGAAANVATDQFSFGVTAYEILAGARPFTGATWAELAKSIERGDLRSLTGVPGWLDAAIRRCVAADPDRRFASLAAVADHLVDRAQRRRPAVWIAGAATAAVLASTATWFATRSDARTVVEGPTCTVGATEIAGVWSARQRETSKALGEPTLSAVDGWAARWASEHDATCSASRTEPIAKVAARERCLVRQRDQLSALLEHSTSTNRGEYRMRETIRTSSATFEPMAGTERDVSERMTDALAAMPPDDCRYAQAGSADPMPADPDRAKVARTVERTVPNIRAAIALGDARPVLAETADLVAKAQASGHAPTLADALLVRAEALRATGDLAGAAIAARDALAAAERGHDDQTAARAWVTRVMLAGDRRDLAAADDLAAVASGAIDRAGAPPRLAAQLLRLRALVAYNRGKFDEATALLVDARTRFVKLSGEQSVDVAGVESSLGSTARAAGDLDAAERHHRAALAIDRAIYARGDKRDPGHLDTARDPRQPDIARDPKHLDIARDLHNLAGVLRLRKDLDAALPLYTEALAIIGAIRGERSIEAALTRNSLGLVKLARRELDAARADFMLARDVFIVTGHGDRAFAEHNLGLVAAAMGDHAGALAFYDRAATAFTSTIGDDAVAPIRVHLDRANSLVALKRFDAARAEAKLALDAATRADIPWIVDEARALLAARPAIAPAKKPEPKPDAPKPPKPVKDVGTYGSSQGW